MRELPNLAEFTLELFLNYLLFKEVNNFSIVILNLLIGTVVSYFSLFTSTLLISKIGLAKNLRLSFLISFVSGISMLFIINNGFWPIIIFNILRSIVNGFYWGSVNVMEYNEIKAESRTKILSFMIGFERIIFTLFPIIFGLLLSLFNHPTILLIPYIFFWGLSLLIPLDFIKHDKYTFSFKKLFNLPKHTYFNDLINLRILITTKWGLGHLMSSLIPIVVFTSAIQIGELNTVIAICSGVFSFFLIKNDYDKKVNNAKLPIVLSTLNHILLTFFITPIGYVIFSIVQTFTSVFTDNLEGDMEVRGIKVFVNNDFNISLETNVANEFVNMVMKSFVFIIAFTLTYLTGNISLTLQLDILLYAIITIIMFYTFRNFIKRHTKLLEHN